jgi:two-component system NtrC family sensor kinase
MVQNKDTQKGDLAAWYQRIFENAAEGVALLGIPELQIVDANQKVMETTGYTREELLQKRVFDLFRPEDMEKADLLSDSGLGKGGSRSDKISLKKKNGGSVDIDLSVKKIGRGRGSFFLASFRELTEQRRIEEKIRESKKSLENIFDGIRDQVSLQSPDLNILRVNRPLATTYQSHFRDLIGKKCYTAYYQRSVPCEKCPVLATLKTKQPSSSVMALPDKKVLRIFTYPILDEKGNLSSVIECTQDITEERRLQEQRFQKEKLAGIGILASGAAHEINNPLSGIIGMAEIAMELEDLSEIRSYLKDILDCSERIGEIVNGLRTYSRMAKKEELSLIDLNEVIEESLKTVQGAIEASVEVTKNYQPFVKIEAHEGELKQVFTRLINNACEAMEGKKGILALSTRPLKDSIEVKVGDNGVGIPPKHLNQIFDPFFTTKKHGEGEGTGLSLNIVYRIITKYEGTIDVESQENEGTTFTVTFPKRRGIL